MKILLLNPPLFDPKKYGKDILLGGAPALGLGYIGALLKKEGLEVSVVDLYFHSWREAERLIRKQQPAIVGITCLTEGRTNAFRLADLVKSISPDVKVVLGGHHATYMCKQILEHYQSVDYIVRGEGEKTFLELTMAMASGGSCSAIKGLAFRDGSRIVLTPHREPIADLDSLPFPLYDHFDFNAYPDYRIKAAAGRRKWRRGERYVSMVTSRGCPGNCHFCSSTRFWRSGWRARSPESVIGEIEMLCKDYDAGYINFADDAFTVDQERAIAICKGIIAKKLDIVWDCTTRINHVSEETMRWMKRAGCLFTCFGIESGSGSILKSINKGIGAEEVIEGFKSAKKAGLDAVAYIMVGNPGESEPTIKETASLLRTIRPRQTGISIAMVFPGSALYSRAKSDGLLNDAYWLTELPPPPYTAEHSEKQLQAWKENLLYASLPWHRKPRYHYMYHLRGPAFSRALRCRDFLAEKTGVKITRRSVALVRRGSAQ